VEYFGENPKLENMDGAIVCPSFIQHANTDPHDRIRIRPRIGLASAKHKMGGAWRIWAVCRNLDSVGDGAIKKEVLMSFMLSIGVNRKNIDRWIKQAITCEYFKRVVQYEDGTILYLLNSETIVAKKFNLDKVDARYVWIETEKMFEEGWRELVWNAFIAVNINGKSISRTKIEEMTGYERHRQARLEQGQDIETILNLELTNVPASQVEMFRDNGVCAFTYCGKVAVRLPDTRLTEMVKNIGGKGRSKHVNHNLMNQSTMASCILGAGAHNRFAKLFFDDDRELDRAFRRYSRQDRNISKLYLLTEDTQFTNKRVRVWSGVNK